MLGQAPAMQDVFRAIGRLSHSAATVLITGESGTGKELVARALHQHSPRANGPFVAINTAAIPKDLLESELFGHERGAFTGAQTMRRGRFEQAEDGTLFLDEIGDMPFDLQTRLLRVLSDGQFYRVGGHNPLQGERARDRGDAPESRIARAAGPVSRGLVHRLNVIRLRLPALRERSEDIPLLTRHFLQKSARDLGVEPKRISEDALAYLASLPFPGNVRQLENLCHWLTVMAPAQTIEQKDLPPDLTPTQEYAGESTSLTATAEASATSQSAAAAQRHDQRAGDARRGTGRRAGQRVGERLAHGSRAAVAREHRRRDGRTRAPFRSGCDPRGARFHARPQGRGGGAARHRPQHDHAQDPGTASRRMIVALAASLRR